MGRKAEFSVNVSGVGGREMVVPRERRRVGVERRLRRNELP
jgi:hypothetical protein